MDLKLILVLSLACCTLAAVDRSCRKEGQYCLNHTDCCSNYCLSNTLRCSRDTPSSDIQSSEEDQSPDSISYKSVLQFMDALKNEPAALEKGSNSIQSQMGEDYEDSDIESDANDEEEAAEGMPQCLRIGKSCHSHNECCTHVCNKYIHRCTI